MRIRVATLLVLFLLLFAGQATAATNSNHVVVLDQSGSLEPFYNHPQDRLRKFLTEVYQPGPLFADADRVTLMLFSEAGDPVPSPQTPFRGSFRELAAQWRSLAPKLESVRQDTDLIHGLRAGLQESQTDKSAAAHVVWFLTDNVSEKSDPQDHRSTLDFYKALKTDPDFQVIKDIQVFPMDLEHPTVNTGLMLYVMLVVPPDTPVDLAAAQEQYYQSLTRKLTGLNRPEFMSQLPLLVKPLTSNPYHLELIDFAKQGGKSQPVEDRNGIVTLPKDLFTEGDPITGTLTARLVSNYETFKVPPAKLRATLSDPRTIDFDPVKPGLQKIFPEDLSEQAARTTSAPFQVLLELPPLSASWNWKSILTGTKGMVETDMTLTANIAAGQGLEIDTSRMKHLQFHDMTELPKLFAQDVNSLPVAVTLRIPVSYSPTRFIVGLIGFGLLVLLVVLGVYWLVRCLTAREEWVVSNPDETESEVTFRRAFLHSVEYSWNANYIGKFVRKSRDYLIFVPSDGSESVDLEGGGSFSVTVDDHTRNFRIDPRDENSKGDDVDDAG